METDISNDSDNLESSIHNPRSWRAVFLFLLPVILCGLSYFIEDSGILRDLGMLSLVTLCMVFLVLELRSFTSHFGVGGILVFGGVLLWFCYDYFTTYFGADPNTIFYSQTALSKAAFALAVLLLGMVIGIRTNIGRPVEYVIGIIPEPGNGALYLIVIVCLFLIGLSPYYFFSNDSFLVTIYKSMTSMRAGDYAAWTVGRTGNLNYNWGAYIPMISAFGHFSGILGVFYAVFIAKNVISKIVGYSIWIFWTLIGFGTGARGGVVFTMLPAVFFVFISNTLKISSIRSRRFSWKAYSSSICLLVITLVTVQFQSLFRNVRVDDRDWRQVNLTNIDGNQMFTEGLLAAEQVPDHIPFFKNSFFGEGALRIIPDLAWSFIIHPIPRALWHDKPVDAAWEWYNNATTGLDSRNSTTIAPGMSMSNYMRYGLGGVFVMGFIFGALCRVCEKVIQSSLHRPIQLLAGMALGVWLFKCYRDTLLWAEMWPLIFAFIGFSIMVGIFRNLGFIPRTGSQTLLPLSSASSEVTYRS